jgi:CRISPR-associated protein Cas1
LKDTVRVSDRNGIVYIERSRVSVKDGAVIRESCGSIHFLPVEMTHALALGPGATITHQAMRLCMRAGCTVAWTSTDMKTLDGLASAPLSHAVEMAEAQAEISAISKHRLEAARILLEMRFGERPDIRLSENQLRGWEGTRMKRIYRETANECGITWNGRRAEGLVDLPNAMISQGNAVLYTAVQIASTALNLSPSLGILHRGYRRSFIFDIADIYKPEVVIKPVFRMIGQGAAEDEIMDVVVSAINRVVWSSVTSDIKKVLLW